jgi:hypothetical protein
MLMLNSSLALNVRSNTYTLAYKFVYMYSYNSDHLGAVVWCIINSPTAKCNYWAPSLWGANFIKLLKARTISKDPV